MPPRTGNVAAPVVLVIDDVADNRDLYAEFLRYSGLEVVTATSAEDGLAQAFTVRPAVVVMDLGLPNMDGCDATRLLKSDPRTRGTPVVVLTGYAEREMLERARAAGADAVLTKPCVPMDLLECVRSFLVVDGDDGADEPVEEGADKARARRKRRA